jgi:hypothetical protein
MKNYISIIILLSMFWMVKVQAHVELIYPEGGETFFSGDTVSIKWTELVSHNTQNWELYYSSDAGEIWVTISDNIDYSLREYKWAVPFEETTTGRIKVIQNNSGTDYEDECPNFTIDNITGIWQNGSVDILFNSFNIFPNPFATSTTIEYQLKQPSDVIITVFNHLGKQVEMIQRHQTTGKQQVSWNAEGLPSGMYFFTLKAGAQVASGKMVLVQ